MDSAFSKRLEPILNKVGKKHGIPIREGRFILDQFMISMKKAFDDPRMPHIYLPILKLVVTKRRIRFWVNKVQYWHKAFSATDRLSRANEKLINARLKYIWPIWKRLHDEENGGLTFWPWKRKANLKRMKRLKEHMDYAEAHRKAIRRKEGKKGQPSGPVFWTTRDTGE